MTHLWNAYTSILLLEFPQDDVAVFPSTYRTGHTSRTEAEDDETNLKSVVRVGCSSECNRSRIDNSILCGEQDTCVCQLGYWLGHKANDKDVPDAKSTTAFVG